MRVVGLISGGKDSCYNMMQCVAAGHEIVALANIEPKGKDELDSYMYQTVGHQGITMIAEAMKLPLFRRATKGNALVKGRMYQKTENDEVEDLYDLLKDVKEKIHIEGVAVGAILSDYQRVRVENVCGRLGLVSLAYLWRRDQTELLQEMINCQVYAIVIKVAALGLEPNILGKPLWALQSQFLHAKEKYGLNVCGEGGEYETFTLDCPLFKSRIVVDETQVIVQSNDPIAPVGYINLLKLHLEPKNDTIDNTTTLPIVKTSLDFISDINESSYSDLSDLEVSETELENVEEINRIRRQSMSESSSMNPLLECQTTNDSNNLTATLSCPSIVIENSCPNVFKQGKTNTNDNLICEIFNKQNSLNQIDASEIVCKEGQMSNDLNKSNQMDKRIRALSCSLSYPFSPIEYEMEKDMIEDNGSINSNISGWHWIGGIVGESASSSIAMEDAMKKLCRLLSIHDLCLNNICTVTLYVRDMGQYASLNDAYIKAMSFPNPPARACVECPLPDGVGVILEALAYKIPDKETAIEMDIERHTMHVQGISHWAPANIGPYSQAVRIGDIINVAGQIPLVPGSMSLVEGSELIQCRLALRHVQRVLNAIDSKTQIRDVVQAICYVTHPHLISEARRQWEGRTNNAIVDYIVVPKLPRDAPIEWHVWAHRHNSRFEYEETGCNIGEYKVAIRRRWNYENNVSAVVCYVATASSPSSSQLSHQSEEAVNHHKILATAISIKELIDILKYSIKKLLCDYNIQEEGLAVMNLRIFYKVSISPNVRLLIEALKVIKHEMYKNLVFTVVPVIHLHNNFTFLSISAVRHET